MSRSIWSSAVWSSDSTVVRTVFFEITCVTATVLTHPAESAPGAPVNGGSEGRRVERWWAVTAYVIIPGIDGSDGQHWQSLWERQWGTSAVRIRPASWSAPDLDDWVDAVQEAYDDASRREGQVVLVAHSLGCWAASTWLNKNPSSRRGGRFHGLRPPDPTGRFSRAARRSRGCRPALPCRWWWQC
ncbi:RBBP9/YdeN family alpha/beta hydrolase [Streptomyces sp. DHE17-7]|uniref:RBBP9/YdeN family alpha/beta hydrolase n=1 Tax=Streptomyces sp. DHE17-7 TaxID=2759949 RepID=UPI0022EB3CE8|nr:alpha/beta hydrolase [Streptomyces sp. DHE17-7]